jgi:hypothetical protein
MKHKVLSYVILLFMFFSVIEIIPIDNGISKGNTVLSYSPEIVDFGDVEQGEIDGSGFLIWNSGGCSCGLLTYNFLEDCDWLSINPLNGSSWGTKNFITITIDTRSLNIGTYEYNIMIYTNAGMGEVKVIVNIIESRSNNPPIKPAINGPYQGELDVENSYQFVSSDIDGDYIFYYIDWGDHTEKIRLGPFPPGKEQSLSHSWSEDGTYKIRVKAQDIHGAESDWSTLPVSMPKYKLQYNQFIRFLETHTHLFPILQRLLRLK